MSQLKYPAPQARPLLRAYNESTLGLNRGGGDEVFGGTRKHEESQDWRQMKVCRCHERGAEYSMLQRQLPASGDDVAALKTLTAVGCSPVHGDPDALSERCKSSTTSSQGSALHARLRIKENVG